MNHTNLSAVSSDYLETYDAIVDRMIHLSESVRESGNITKDFVYQMIPHHMAAIEMSQNLLRYTTFIPLQNMAENTVRSQTKSISDMRTVLASCGCHRNSEADAQKYNRCSAGAMEQMFAEMKAAPRGNAINANFIREMIPHHLGGIRMAQCALAFPICDALAQMLVEMIKSETEEIKMMRRLYRYAVC